MSLTPDQILSAQKAHFETLFGLYNVKRAPLDKAKVRQALSLAFPYDDVIAAGEDDGRVLAEAIVQACLRMLGQHTS